VGFVDSAGFMPDRIFFSRTVASICIAADSNTNSYIITYCHIIPYPDFDVNIYNHFDFNADTKASTRVI